MNVLAISPNRNNSYSSNMKKLNSTSFKGGLNDNSVRRVVDMLKPKISSIRTCSNVSALGTIIYELTRKYTNNSIGMMIVPDNEIVNLLGKNASKYDTVNNKGLCIAVGDKYVPMEYWSECYDAVLALLPKLK